MARKPRLYLEGCAQHIIQRGNNRSACFGSDEDYKAYLHYLKEAAVKYSVEVHAFVLMTNHVHLLVTPANEKATGLMMQSIGRRYVQYFNHTYGRTGTLWEGRYKSTLVDSETYLLTLYRYIELNPVRACMVGHAAEYPWSSYQHNALGKEIKLISGHSKYMELGEDPESRQKNYRTLFCGHMKEEDIKAIRTASEKAWILGSEKFYADFERRTGLSSFGIGRGGDRKSRQFRESGF